MDWYRVTLHLRGPTGTPWQADTIFGHLCWALRHRRGEAALKDFLTDFSGGLPHFLLSDGFPGDLLPRPLLMSFPQADTAESLRQRRDARKVNLLSMADFQRALRGEAFFPERPAKEPVATRVAMKNQISRLTGTTGDEGQLFGFTEYWLPQVTIYLKAEEGYIDEARELFGWLAETGYGKRKSVGYGAIDSVAWEPFDGFPPLAEANAFVTLSAFVPTAADPTKGRWRLRVKYGRLGEEYAVGGNPFKRPIVMLAPGSAFRGSPVQEYYGRMVTDVSAEHPEVVHYGYALPVPMRWPPDQEAAE